MKYPAISFLIHICLCNPILFSDEPLYPEVVGDERFQDKIRESLNLIYSKAPATLDFINKYIKRIEQYNRTGMCAYCQPPTYQVALATVDSGPYWLASTIAHDSYHSYLYHLYRDMLGGKTPKYELWAGFDADRRCNRFQLQTLYEIDANEYLITYMKKQDGTHCDINHDGKCDYKDYLLREWKLK